MNKNLVGGESTGMGIFPGGRNVQIFSWWGGTLSNQNLKCIYSFQGGRERED